MSFIIDFKEIPPGNIGGSGQDEFELFSRDFLEALGFKIIYPPNRGPDNGKDMIVSGKWNGSQTILWLVSCKHNAHSKTSHAVNCKDEINIIERLTVNKCKGFIGIYSTIAATTLSTMLYGLKDKIQSEIFDHRLIEKLILEKIFI